MAFGQASGPAASARQVSELLELLQRAGHRDFRDARGPMAFTQRQAGGKFTAQEAADLIEQLQEDEYRRERGSEPERIDTPAAIVPPDPALRRFPDRQLAAELQRRGWIVVEP